MAEDFAKGSAAGCLACAVDAIDRTSEIADKVNAKKLRYELGSLKNKITSLLPLVEKIGS
jgi:hypothetical protein